MPVNLADGQEMFLRKNGKGKFDKLRIKLGWYTPHKINSLWFSEFFKSNAIECHAYMLMCQDELRFDYKDIINYCNAEHPSHSVRYLGKCLDDKGNVSEIMMIDPEKIPLRYNMVVFMADVSKSKSGNQHFGMVKNVYVNILNEDNNQQICNYNLSQRYDGMTSILFGALCRCDRGWEFVAVGEGSTGNVIDNLVRPVFYDEERRIAI